MRFVCPLVVVQDMAVAREFYHNVLGQEVKYDFGENIEFQGGFSIHLADHFQGLLPEGKTITRGQTHNFELYFETEELDVTITRLKNAGVTFAHEIITQPWQQRAMRFYDPDGNLIEVGEAMETVVARLYKAGLTMAEVSEKSSMPLSFVEDVISKL